MKRIKIILNITELLTIFTSTPKYENFFEQLKKNTLYRL